MSCFNKEDYKRLKKAAKAEGDIFTASTKLSCPVVLGTAEVSAVSVAFRPAIENSNCKMLEVAVSYCSAEDEFKPKHGKYQALLKLVNRETVQMPLAKFLRTEGAGATADVLLEIFSM